MPQTGHHRFLFSPLPSGGDNGSSAQRQTEGRTNAEQVIYIEELQTLNEELRQARRAALNLMEDAILSKEALHKSEEKYRTLFESIDEGFCIIEMLYNEGGQAVDYRFLEVNQSFERQTGLKDVVGKSGKALMPGNEPYWLETYDKVAQTGRSIRFENYHEATERWYESYASRAGGAESRQVAVVFNDVTGRKNAGEILRESEERKSFLLTLSDALRPIADPTEIQETVTGVAMDYFKADRCYYCEIEGDQCIIRRDALKEGLPSVAGGYSLSSMPVLKNVIDRGKPFVVHDVNTTGLVDEPLRKLCLQLQVISFVNIPVIKNGKPAVVLCVVQGTPRAWTDFDVELAEEIAERTWAAVEKAKVEEALRESEERKALLLTLSDTLQTITDPIKVQDAAMRVLGEQLGMSRACYFHVESDDEGWVRVIESAYQREPGGPGMIGRHSLKPFGNWLFEGLAEGKVVDVSDVAAVGGLTEEELAIYRGIGVAAFLNVPLLRHGVYTSGIAVHSNVPRAWKPAEIELIREVAERTWDALERMRAEEALRESEERFRTLANAVPQVIWTNDAEGKAAYFNQRWYEYTGLTYGQSAGPGWQAVVHPGDAPASVEKWKTALAAGEIFDAEYRLRRHDGTYCWFIGRNVPLKDEAGKVTGWFGSATDIQELKTTTDALSQSEERLRITMESAADYAIITMDTGRRIERWSGGATKMFGFTEAEVIGQSADIIFTEEDREAGAPQQEMETARNTGRAADERWHRRKDGSRFFASGVLRPIFNSGLSGYVKVARDVTEQKKAEETLRIVEERYRIALQSAEMGAWDWNVTADEVTWNEQHFRLFGLEPVDQKLDAGFFLQLVHEADRQRVTGELQRAVNETGVYHAEFRARRDNNEEVRWMTGYGRVVEKQDGRSTRMVGVMYDSTERRLFTEELSRLVAERTVELQRSNEDLRQFAHVASHDLKEPVRKIQTFNNRILDEYADALPPRAKTYTEKIGTAADRMVSMIEGVLRYSKLGSTEQALQAVNLNETIQQIAADLEVMMQQKGAVINTGALPTITANPTLMYQLFYNLILNSLKFSKAAEPPRINVRSEAAKEEGNDFIRITLSDNGIGFEPEFAEDIFKTFTRLHPAEDYEGTGLGLALCKKIVERHGGTITASGEPNSGATFAILLPMINE